MASKDPHRGSEFGGTRGRIAPPPHEPTNSETLSLIYATEPAPALTPDQTVEDIVPVTQRRR